MVIIDSLLDFDPVASASFWCYRSKIDAIVTFHINFVVDASRCKRSRCNSLLHPFDMGDAISSYCIDHPLFVASKIKRCNSVLHRNHGDATHVLQRLLFDATNCITSILGLMQYNLLHHHLIWCNCNYCIEVRLDAITTIASTWGQMQYKLSHQQ